jgi:hypothetical protein
MSQHQTHVGKNTGFRTDTPRGCADRAGVLQHRRVLKEHRGGGDIPAFEPACRWQDKISFTPCRILEEVQADEALDLTQRLA